MVAVVVADEPRDDDVGTSIVGQLTRLVDALARLVVRACILFHASLTEGYTICDCCCGI